MQKVDVVIIGASASGLMCAIEAGNRGRTVTVLDHSNKTGKKILMSGGGRCNFTNYNINAENYISHNPHFCKSALSRYTQWDFINMVQRHKIAYHERDHGQLFCDKSAKDILNMLLEECSLAKTHIRLNTDISKIERISDYHFKVTTTQGDFHCQSLVVATGGLSIPTMGASPFGYKLAEQFDINVWPVSAGLVPFTLHTKDKSRFASLSGIAIDAIVQTKKQSFRENILFTHRGLSGPAILQISSYWTPGECIFINLLPDLDLLSILKLAQQQTPQIKVKTLLSQYLPKRLIEAHLTQEILDTTLQTNSHDHFEKIANNIHQWKLKPNATEGYRTAEVTLGGVDCDALSSKTMECHQVPGLYFIGEVVDITGWLGGYNFQWAWSSAWCAGQYV